MKRSSHAACGNAPRKSTAEQRKQGFGRMPLTQTALTVNKLPALPSMVVSDGLAADCMQVDLGFPSGPGTICPSLCQDSISMPNF